MEASKTNIRAKENQLKCTICDYKCTKELTMKKHINTKHSKKSYDCYKCHEVFKDETGLKLHMENKHESENKKETAAKLNSESIVPECSLCDDTFTSQVEYTEHINTHIDEIQGIDFEDLKNRHEMFECSMCDFNSNDLETVKSHLTEHALRPKENTIKKLLPNKLKKAVLQAGDFTDLYDEKGNPLYESTDSEASDAE